MRIRLPALTLLTTAVLQLATGSVTAHASDTERQEILAAARSVIRTTGLATLITLDEQGQPQARTMDPFPPEEDFTIWMATNRSTRKVEQIRNDPRATIHYFDPAGPSYVTLIGHAKIIEDPAERERHWKPGWTDFYEDGPRGEDFLLIHFRPTRLEIVSIEHGIASGPRSWRPAIVEFTAAPR
jgi:general stress protein 26